MPPCGIKARELGLESGAWVLAAAGQADERAEVAVEFDGGEVRVREGMEAIDVWWCCSGELSAVCYPIKKTLTNHQLPEFKLA